MTPAELERAVRTLQTEFAYKSTPWYYLQGILVGLRRADVQERRIDYALVQATVRAMK